jgi:coproporphyrinogen III oxidase-like Fe-S oxidoreductase
MHRIFYGIRKMVYYYLWEDKRCRCAINDLLEKEKNIDMMLHLPFPSCTNICFYCAFTSTNGEDIIVKKMFDFLLRKNLFLLGEKRVRNRILLGF